MAENQNPAFADLIRTVPDFPKEGIMFKDITTLLKDPVGLKAVIDAFAERYKGQKIDYIAGMESRGFIFGMPLAYVLGAGFVPLRKPGKLPAEQYKVDIELEYGKDTLCMHKDAVEKGKRVLIIDDLVATGGTMVGAIELMKIAEAEIVELACVIELPALKARERFGQPLHTLISF